MHFTATLLILTTSQRFKTTSFNGNSTVELQTFTTDLAARLRTL
jgi:hypothetical protein